jgi:hypothetical protein
MVRAGMTTFCPHAQAAIPPLGTMSAQDADNVAITGGTISGLDTPLAIDSGGTGAAAAPQARIALGLQIGVNVQAWDADLDAWALKTAPAGAVLGTTDAQTVTNKVFDTSLNTVSNIALSMFAANVADTDTTLSANSNTRVATQQAIKSYVDTLLTGLKWKAAVVAATTANITLLGAQTIDGISVVAGNRVLVKAQTSAIDNGLYLCAAGAWTRSTDADTGAELVQATVFVSSGTANADTQWTCTNDTITIGATNIAFAQVSGAGTYSAGFGLGLTGTQFSITDAELVAIAGLTSAADRLPYFTGSGTAALTVFTAFARTLLDDVDAPTMRTTLGLGSIATQASSAVAITGGSITGITDIAVADGGTGSSTAAGALTNLGALPLAGGDMSGALTLQSGVALTAGSTTPVSNFYAAGAITPLIQSLSTGQAGVLAARYSNNASPPTLSMAKSRGVSVGSHVTCATSDQVGAVTWGASNGTKFTECSRMVAFLTGSPGTDYSPTEMRLYVSGSGAEVLAADFDGVTGDFRMGSNASTNNVITGARHIQLRSYTVATLPAQGAGMEIYVSDGAGGLRHAVSDGTTWRLENGQDAAQAAINAQVGTTYTLALGDMYRVVEMNNASANTLTIPLNATVAFPVGTIIDVIQTGAGKTTIAGTGGVTVNSTAGLLSVAAQWSTVRLRKRATDTWVVTGSLIA